MKHRLKILILIPVWKRFEAFDIHLQGMKRMIAQTKQYCEILPFYIISEPKAGVFISNNMNPSYNFVHVENKPLGNKLNKGLRQAMSLPFDYLMQMGSDDIISHYLIRHWVRHIDETGSKYFGPDSFTAVQLVGGWKKMICYSTTTIGAGRMLERSVLEDAVIGGEHWGLWTPEANSGLDIDSEENIIERLKMGCKRIRTNPQLIYDIKDKDSINSFDSFDEDVRMKLTPTDFLLCPELEGKVKEEPPIKNMTGAPG